MTKSVSRKSKQGRDAEHTQETSSAPARHPASSGPYKDILTLQRKAGNRAANLATEENLKVSNPGDVVETDADRFAERTVLPILGQEEGAPKQLLRKLDVYIHIDDEAAEAANAMNARAFTRGGEIFFERGEYVPGTAGGQKLLAHELAHVVLHSTQPGMQNQVYRATKGDAGVQADPTEQRKRTGELIKKGFADILRPETVKRGLNALRQAAASLESIKGEDAIKATILRQLHLLISIFESPASGLANLEKATDLDQGTTQVYAQSMGEAGKEELQSENPDRLLAKFQQNCDQYFRAKGFQLAITQKRILAVKRMEISGAAPQHYPPSEADEAVYFQSLKGLDLETLKLAFESYCRAFYKHSGKNEVFNVNDLSDAKVRKAPTNREGYFSSDCQGLFRVGVRLLTQAGCELNKVIVGEKVDNDGKAVGHILGQYACKGQTFVVSNLSIHGSDTEAFMSLRVAHGQDAAHKGFGDSVAEAMADLKRRKQK
jgi:hypothetical protein